METEPVTLNDKKEEKNDLTDNLPQQISPNTVIRKKTFLYISLVLVFLLTAILGGYFLINKTDFLKQNGLPPILPKNCTLNGKTYKPDEPFKSPDGCNSCSCGRDGQISCTAMACDPTDSMDPTSSSLKTTSVPVIASSTQIPLKTYRDEEYGYVVSYNPNNWMFRHTYGKGGISNSDTSGNPKIISGFDLHKPSNINASAIIVLNVLEAKGETDIDQWIKEYDLNVPKNASTQMILNEGFRAREYTYKYDSTDSFARKSRYFIQNDKVFRIFYSEVDALSAETIQVVEEFNP